MEQLVNAVAFPAPHLPRRYYEETLLKREDLVWLNTEKNERIPACFIECEGATCTILYFHGNAEDIALHLPFVDAMTKITGANVLTVEYPGYATSRFESPPGEASEKACYRAAEAGWRYLTEDLGLEANAIIIYGRSIGTGPAVQLSSQKLVLGSRQSPLQARGLFLQSPLESAFRSALGFFSATLLGAYDIFENYKKIPDIPAPIAIVHGLTDTVVPQTGALKLLELTNRAFEPLWLSERGHNDMPYHTVFNYLADFIDASAQDPATGLPLNISPRLSLQDKILAKHNGRR